jgi:F0F1-type ATP synthase assembly protein I
MPGRRFWGLIVLSVTLVFCAIGYYLNDYSPSGPWGLAGLACGLITVFAINRLQKK